MRRPRASPSRSMDRRQGALSETGRSIFQQQTYQYSKGSGAVFEPSGCWLWWRRGGYGSGPSTVVLNVNGQSAADLLDGRVASTVGPGFVPGIDFLFLSNRVTGGSTMRPQTLNPGLIVSWFQRRKKVKPKAFIRFALDQHLAVADRNPDPVIRPCSRHLQRCSSNGDRNSKRQCARHVDQQFWNIRPRCRWPRYQREWQRPDRRQTE